MKILFTIYVLFFLFETQNLISLINVGCHSVCNLDLYISLFFYLYTYFLLQQNDLALTQTHPVRWNPSVEPVLKVIRIASCSA